LGKLANVVGAVVAIANIVSAYDQVKRLENIEKKIDFLIQARRWDQLAKIESIYYQAKEIMARPDFGREEQRELHSLCLALRELRIAWRHEFEYKLEQIDAEREGGAWSSIADLFAKNSREKSHVKQVNQAIGVLEAEIHLIDVSVNLQTALSWAAGQHDYFLNESLPAESRAWKKPLKTLTAKLKMLRRYESEDGVDTGECAQARWEALISRAQTTPQLAQAAFALPTKGSRSKTKRNCRSLSRS
jgi:hypothetical protein